MRYKKLYSFIILAFCSTFFDFMVLSDGKTVFPRDRILHMYISCLLFGLLGFAIKNIDFRIDVLKILTLIVIALKFIVTTMHMTQYFQTYHGSNITGILIFTIVTVFA